MKHLILAALVAAAVAYAAAAPAFTPVVTAPYAAAWGFMAAVQKYFCTRCGVSLSSDGDAYGFTGTTGWKRDLSGDMRPCGGNSIYGGC